MPVWGSAQSFRLGDVRRWRLVHPPREAPVVLEAPGRLTGCATSDGELAEPTPVEDERTAGVALVDGMEPQQDHDVVAGFYLGVDRALETRQSTVEGHGAVVADAHGNPDETMLGRTGELPAHGALVVGKDGHPEVP